MSLQTQLTTAFTRVGTEFKTLRSTLGSNANLTTTAKDTLVNAINEVKAGQSSAGAQINDTTASTTSVYSSSKTQSVANAAALALISDASATSATTTTYSASKINTAITTAVNAAVTGLINGAPTAYDTFKEIADYIASDTSGATAMTASINNKIDYTAAQTYTAAQVTQGSANLAALGMARQADLATEVTARTTLATNVGDTTRDFSGDFTAALV